MGKLKRKPKRRMEKATASTAVKAEVAEPSRKEDKGQEAAKPSQKEDKGEEAASNSKQEGKETASKSKFKEEVGVPSQEKDKGQEVEEPSRKEDKRVEQASHASQIEEEIVESDSTDTDEKDEEAVAAAARAARVEARVEARWNNGLAARLGTGGLILVLSETYTGFAIFMYDGVKLLANDAYQNIWVDFADHTVAKRTASLLEFLVFEDKASAIKPNGVDAKLATMIRKYIRPGQKLAVENVDYKEVIQNSMKISCMCGGTVEELMWGLKVQMPYLVPEENSKLDKEDRFPMSIGMKQLLNIYRFKFEPDLKVTRHIISLAGVVRESDRYVNRHEYSLRSAADHLKRITGIDTQEWDVLKLATALKLISYPKEEIPSAPLLFPKQLLLKLRKDAPKYDGKIYKELILKIYNEMYKARCTRSRMLGKLSHLLQQRQKIQEVIVQLTECKENLREGRNTRQNPPTLAPADALRRYTCISSHQLHMMNEPGILSMHIHPSKDVVATGGFDTNAVLFDQPSGQILCTLTGHTKKVTTLKFVDGDELLITGSADKTVRMWCGREDGNYRWVHTLIDHTAEVAAVTVQESEKYFVSASKDNSWCLYDFLTGSCKSKVCMDSLDGYTSASFHPHGLLLGTGTATAAVRIWDVKNQANIANLRGHTGPVRAMSFSNNGYLLATAARDGVRLWDVRKLTNLRTISPYDSSTATNAVEFDSSGRYLGIAGSDARVYQADKDEWNIITTLPALSGPGRVTTLNFGADAKYIAVGSMDNLGIFGLLGDEQMDA